MATIKVEFLRGFSDDRVGLRLKGDVKTLKNKAKTDKEYVKALIRDKVVKIYVEPPKARKPEKVNDDAVFPKTQPLPETEGDITPDGSGERG